MLACKTGSQYHVEMPDHRYAANIYLSSEVLSGFKNCKNSHSGESTGENTVFSLANSTY
jgi:hypothetical protein